MAVLVVGNFHLFDFAPAGIGAAGDDVVAVHCVRDGIARRFVHQTEADGRWRPLQWRMVRRRTGIRPRKGQTEPPALLVPDAADEAVERRPIAAQLVFQADDRGAPTPESVFDYTLLLGRRHDGRLVQFAQAPLLLSTPLGAQQVAEDVEEEEDRHRVQVSEKSLQKIPKK